MVMSVFSVSSAEVVAKEVAAAVQEQMTRELQEVQSRLSQQETHSTKYVYI